VVDAGGCVYMVIFSGGRRTLVQQRVAFVNRRWEKDPCPTRSGDECSGQFHEEQRMHLVRDVVEADDGRLILWQRVKLASLWWYGAL
jgi:hypothetical protein